MTTRRPVDHPPACGRSQGNLGWTMHVGLLTSDDAVPRRHVGRRVCGSVFAEDLLIDINLATPRI